MFIGKKSFRIVLFIAQELYKLPAGFSEISSRKHGDDWQDEEQYKDPLSREVIACREASSFLSSSSEETCAVFISSR